MGWVGGEGGGLRRGGMALLLLKPVTAACDRLAHGCCPEDRPSPVFLGFAVLLNGPVAAYALAIGVRQAGSGCDDRLPTFLLVAAGVNAAMIAFAGYLYRKFSRPYSRHDPDDSGPWARASNICLNDPGAALFILVLIFSAIWANLGLSWARRGGCEARELTQAVRLVGSLMNVFLLAGAGVLLFSLGVESCRHHDRQGGILQDFWGGPSNFAERESSTRGRGQSRAGQGRWAGAGNAAGAVGAALVSLFGDPPNTTAGRAAERETWRSNESIREPVPAFSGPNATRSGSRGSETTPVDPPPPYSAAPPQFPSMPRPESSQVEEVAIGIPVHGDPQPSAKGGVEGETAPPKYAADTRPSAPPAPCEVEPQPAVGPSRARNSEGGPRPATGSDIRDERLQQAKQATKQAAGVAQKQALLAMKGVGKAMAKFGKALEEQAASSSSKAGPGSKNSPSDNRRG